VEALRMQTGPTDTVACLEIDNVRACFDDYACEVGPGSFWYWPGPAVATFCIRGIDASCHHLNNYIVSSSRWSVDRFQL